MRTVTVYLVVNGRGDCRVNKRRPELAYDEVAYEIRVNIPQGWGSIYRGGELTLPEAPAAMALEVGEPERYSAEVE